MNFVARRLPLITIVTSIVLLTSLAVNNVQFENHGQIILDPVLNKKLKTTTISVFETWSDMNCIQKCLRIERCQSVNTKTKTKDSMICETLASRSEEGSMVEEEGWKHYTVKKAAPICCMIEEKICLANERCVDDHSQTRGYRCLALPNIALGRPTSQLSTFSSFSASEKAVDGNRNSRYFEESCSHTDISVRPWWKVDFGYEAQVQAVSITNRIDCCSERLRRFVIYVGNQQPGAIEGNNVCLDNVTMTGIETKLFKCTEKVHGRYLYISSYVRDYLVLCEVEVYGRSNAIPKC